MDVLDDILQPLLEGFKDSFRLSKLIVLSLITVLAAYVSHSSISIKTDGTEKHC